MRQKKAGRLVKVVLAEGVCSVLELVPDGSKTRYIEDLIAEDFKRGKMGLFSRYSQRETELAGLAAAAAAVAPAQGRPAKDRYAPGTDPNGAARLPGETLDEYLDRQERLRG